MEGIFTHFSTADYDEIFLKKQVEKFKEFLGEIPSGISPIVHIGGGAGERVLCQFNDAMLRVGLRLYFPNPVLKIESEIVNVIHVKAGERVGYSNGYIAKENICVGVVPLGYADGVNRKLSGRAVVFVNGQKCKIIGNVCMDMFFIQIGDKIKVGDKVQVFSSARDWANIADTIEYEILTNLNLTRMDKIVKY